jgi:hypothetical protein
MIAVYQVETEGIYLISWRQGPTQTKSAQQSTQVSEVIHARLGEAQKEVDCN